MLFFIRQRQHEYPYYPWYKDGGFIQKHLPNQRNTPWIYTYYLIISVQGFYKVITVNRTVRSLAPPAFQGFSFCQQSWKLKNSWWILFASWSLGFESHVPSVPLEKSLLILSFYCQTNMYLAGKKFYATFFVTTWNFRMSLKNSRCWKIIWTVIKTFSGVIHHGLVAFSDPVKTLEQRWPCWRPSSSMSVGSTQPPTSLTFISLRFSNSKEL